MKNNIVVGFLCLLCIAYTPAFAATINASPAESSVMFRLNHDLGYTVGYFNNFSATLDANDDQSQIVSANIQVKTDSINTRNAIRDEGLRSSLFLETGKFPQAVFESTKVEGDQVSGLLTIKGIVKPISFKLERDSAKKKIVLKGSFNRHDYGITYNPVMAHKKKIIGDRVELIIELNIHAG